MSRAAHAWSALALLGVVATAGCSFDESAQSARGCGPDCAPNMCYLGYCLASVGSVQGPVQGAGTGGGAGVSAGASGAGASGTGAVAGTGAGTGAGAGASGMGAAGSAGGGAGGAGGAGAGSGGTGGVAPPSCIASDLEVCNGLDDDCDGESDEDTTVPCYPDALPGCAPSGAGGYDCAGLCTPGTRVCENGVLRACAGHVGPAEEECGGTEARDENCNGAVDDGCPCSGDETQSCYDGPFGTAGVGRCRRGTQQCENGLFGDCTGSITPRLESCANLGTDDDCNGILDNVFGIGFGCTVDANVGECRNGQRACRNGALACVPPAPRPETACDGRDEDCDGRFDETFDLDSDPANCGACGVVCGTGQACCNRQCVATDTNAHCGGCGGCQLGQECCNRQCVATDTNAHCGGCGGCQLGQECCDRQCVATDTNAHCGGCGGCQPGQECCGRQCVATDTETHCGGCDACSDGQLCCDRQCVSTGTAAHCSSCAPCAEGQDCCGASCVDLGNNDDHCGGCFAGCGGGECACVASECVNPGGLLCR